MKNIKVFNKIAKVGLERFPADYAVSDSAENYDGALVRSAALHEENFPETLLGIARAGAGVNNIPIDKCTAKGIAVFNTPGANANAVKELVIAALLLGSRKIYESIAWARTLEGTTKEISAVVEKNKSNFVGPEIAGKTLGVIGLGAIGSMVANAAHHLDMNVIGYDPYISVKNAWTLSRNVKYAATLEELLPQCDYITLHMPVLDSTKGFFNEKLFGMCKKGVRIMNFSRGELINEADLIKALEDGTVDKYVTDFPSENIIRNEKVIPVPHLGASTPESEDNCARMAVDQLALYLETGNVVNSVNLPACEMPYTGHPRIAIIHKNIPNMVGQFTATLASHSINIANMTNRSRGEVAYTLIDIDGELHENVEPLLGEIEGIIKVRII